MHFEALYRCNVATAVSYHTALRTLLRLAMYAYYDYYGDCQFIPIVHSTESVRLAVPCGIRWCLVSGVCADAKMQ